MIFAGQYKLDKANIAQSHLCELDMILIHMKQLEKEKGLKLGWYHRKEDKDSVTYYFAEHGHYEWVKAHHKILTKK
jgi:hypothetical protein